jgi:hypothetical protein
MADEQENNLEKCPMCGGDYDPDEHEILTCIKCGSEGSTHCCMSNGIGTRCINCEESEDEFEVYDDDE